MAASNNILHTILLVAGIALTAGVLGVVIAILVNQSNTNSPTSTEADIVAKTLNIAPPSKVDNSNPKYQSYQQVVQLYKASANLSADPCNDFYAYACGNFKGAASFDVSDSSNTADMIAQLTDDTYISTAPLPVQQTRWYFDACVSARQNWTNIVANGTVVTNAINKLAAGLAQFPNRTVYPFPMLDQSTNVTAFPGAYGLGYLTGSLTAQGVDTIISASVDTNWKDPSGPDGFAYMLDQPTTFADNTYYLKDWANLKFSLNKTITETMLLLASVQNKTLDRSILQEDVNDIINLDQLLALNFSTDDTTRRQQERSYNPNTLSQLRDLYHDTIFSWHMFLPLAVGPAEHVLDKLLNGNSFQYYITMEPLMLNKLLLALNEQNTYGITPRALVNYFYYRLVDSLSQFLPWPTQSDTVRPYFKVQKQPFGRRRRDLPNKRKHQMKQIDDFSQAQTDCIGETIEMMQYANARVFIDKIYPTAQDRKNVREHVAKVASSIVIGFRSMIDQLDWMTTSTKKGAYNKIENLVKNIAYPDWITDDKQLTDYHAQMNFTKDNDYITMYFNAVNFGLYKNWDQLVIGAADRTGFNGAPGVTNAWYQPELNSITFPAGILKKPFYDFSWPASVNFGAMGVIAGHELTHGFDDEGVQWNGVGALSGWMDSQSQKSFTSMAQCVVDEYNNFCPLDKATYGAAACIDGAQTQGENIADNGGIHSAFRAYKNYVNLYGPDAALPDDIFQYFNPDQLFFMSFAQVWCDTPESDEGFLRQILVDVHSPAIYRVLGSIQNFPAFKSAFNCPSSTYAPDQHCNVWVSDIDTTYGLPNVQTDLNVAPEAQITSRDVDKMNAYQMAVNYYSKSVNTSINPCDDFFGYACGSFNQPVSFYTARAQNLVYMSQKLEDPKYYNDTIINCPALIKERQFYNACLVATVNYQTEDNILLSKNYIQAKISALQVFIGQPFTMVNGGTATLPNSKQLADALGYLSFTQGIDTLISPLVDTYWIDNSKGYQLFIDQNTGYLSKTFYQPAAWKNEKPKYFNTAFKVIQRYSREQNITLPAGLNDTLSRVLDFEQMIATDYSTDDDTRRHYNRSWNLVEIGNLGATYTFLDWTVFFSHVPATAQPKLVSAYPVSIMEVDRIKSFSNDYKTLDANLLVNLLYLRQLLGNAQYIPSYISAFRGMTEESVFLGLSRRRTIPNHIPPNADVEANGPSCAGIANNLMQYANGRVFVDYMYPTAQSVEDIRASAGGIIGNVITSFQGMIDQLDWMTPDTKKKAYDKTVNIKQNVAFPDWIRNDSLLSAYYADLVIADGDNYYDIYDKLVRFNIEVQYNQLNAAPANRNDFLGQPATVNAWYQPQLNSITFPAGILVPPYFNPLWPPSINYGAMGLVAGHELTHGFDDEGVQWGPTGNLDDWMDDTSKTGFQNMAKCVINEYNNFCPLNASLYTPNCVKGTQTQGENIADNGGVHAAFNAYKTHQALDGPDPRLPDRLFGQFTHDQLFFMSFAQVWCTVRPSDDDLYTSLMTDPHSPSMYRVAGTIQNFPAFQTAFNCPLGSASAPKDHCEVWVPKKYQ